MALNNPDETVPGHKDRTVYHKIIKGKLLRAVTRGDTVITAYHMSKIKNTQRESNHMKSQKQFGMVGLRHETQQCLD
ncbi:MAG: hypothetical protein A3K25_02805 [Planctomycetes bacterium RIFOXYB12_FULL_42_10]|nr:MAG: hypothetical protein A2069_00245 [Planctomycetes bacterium GWB2_41_19]OHC07240.1 MAG: hypothetical protein A3K25_02805 [Planctomycetes bacterium RIFOXYB12_FULL_42_10]